MENKTTDRRYSISRQKMVLYLLLRFILLPSIALCVAPKNNQTLNDSTRDSNGKIKPNKKKIGEHRKKKQQQPNENYASGLI